MGTHQKYDLELIYEHVLIQMIEMYIFIWFVLLVLTLLCLTIDIENYKTNPSGFELCKNPNHNSLTDCQLALSTKKWGEFTCEIANIMFYTKQIRKNNERQINYRKVLRVFEHIINNNIEFPLDCRVIGSMLTNIYMCSSDSTEAAWAQGVNMFVQFEKMHILSDQKTGLGCDSKVILEAKGTIFEGYHCHNGDLFRNVYIRDVENMKAFTLVLFLYKRALKLLITEPRSITYSVYSNKKNPDHNVINTFLNLT